MLPAMPCLAAKMVRRTRLELDGSPLEAGICTVPETQDRRCRERNADDVLEHRAVTVPADTGTRIISRNQRLHEIS